MEREVRFSIGPVSVRLRSHFDCDVEPLAAIYRPFAAQRPPTSAHVIEVDQHVDAEGPVPGGRQLFANGHLYRILETGEGRAYVFSDPRGIDYRSAVFSDDLSRGSVRNLAIYRRILGESPEARRIYYRPFSYPLDQLLLLEYVVVRRLGVVLHAAAVAREGRALLLCGSSGAGKSTLARLLDGWTPLCDDRSLVGEEDGQVVCHGTPWHGTEMLARPGSAPLAAVLFLERGEDRLEEVGEAQAFKRLLFHAFPPFWNREGMEVAADLCARLAARVCTCRFAFRPGPQAVAALEGLLARWE